MAFSQYWTVLGRDYPPCAIALHRTREALHAPYSLAFFCPILGEIWARRAVAHDASGQLTKWAILHVPSPDSEGAWVAHGAVGSILTEWETEQEVAALPYDLLVREFILQSALPYLPTLGDII